MSIDPETGRLFWDNQEVVTTLSLPWWGQIAIIATAVATVVMALSMAVPQIVRFINFIRKHG